jgi:CheY-like chemotaxis protein
MQSEKSGVYKAIPGRFGKDLPIIGVTAFANKEDKEKALEAFCDEYLTKPLNSESLLSVINNYIRKLNIN